MKKEETRNKKIKIKVIKNRAKRKVFFREIEKNNDIYSPAINFPQKEINPNILKLLQSEEDAILLVGCIEEYIKEKKHYAFKMREKDGVIGKFFVELYSIFPSTKLLLSFEEFIVNNMAFKTGVEVATNIEEFNIGKFEELCFQNQKRIPSSLLIDFIKNVKNINYEYWEDFILNEFDWLTYIKYCKAIERADITKFQNRLILQGNVFCVVEFAKRVQKTDLVEIALFLLDRNKLNEIPYFDVFAGQNVVNRLIERVADSGNLELCKRIKNDINLDEYQKALINFAISIMQKGNKRDDTNKKNKTKVIEKEVDMPK